MDRDTLFITSKTNDPAYNLATEEVLLRNFKNNIIFFYINSPSVIVGKHQNTLAEVNHEFLEKNNIPVYRRLSGGGTVYHDYGNINYCIIENGEPGHLVDFVRATTPVVEALRNYGLDARHGKRNDLLAGYKKISGNACHVFKSRAMHHGTLLFNSNLSKLTESLKADATKFRDKSVKSVRSEVVNISELVPENEDVEIFLSQIGSFLQNKYNASTYHFSEPELSEIKILAETKYKTWEWNYGYSPTYEFSKRYKSDEYVFSTKLKVEKGIIRDITLKTNHPNKEKIVSTTNKLIGTIHEKAHVEKIIEEIENETRNNLLSSLF
ncbi:lipoate--protein ligase family protein [Marinilabilia salmonicolor]|uniref:lipoate--protein ligase family protein n=1 Tax=Marinilabilia salmonicolor TaxID=989 RepID=UPI00029B15E7|nr:lipoate--protein ligase [Marinilabilia salmonicolor]